MLSIAKTLLTRRAIILLTSLTLGYLVFSFISYIPLELDRYTPHNHFARPHHCPPEASGPGRPPVPISQETDPSCDPFNSAATLRLNHSHPFSTTLTTLSRTCYAASPSWINGLKHATATEPVAALQDRTVLLLGDSVDRFLLTDLCATLHGNLTVHPVDSYTTAAAAPDPGAKVNGGLPRSCRIAGPSGRQNLTLVSYFFYGYDELDIWRDKTSTWAAPATFAKRWNAFVTAYATLFSPSTPPDLVLVNVGLWELARFDRQAEAVDAESEPVVIDDAFVGSYVRHTVDFLERVRTLVGERPRIRWRQMHTPKIASGSYFVNTQGDKKKNRQRFSAPKVHALNVAAAEACRIAGEREMSRRGRKCTRRGDDDGRVDVWPVGDLILPWPTGMWLRDDIHQTPMLGAAVWGGGVLEYLARAPR